MDRSEIKGMCDYDKKNMQIVPKNKSFTNLVGHGKQEEGQLHICIVGRNGAVHLIVGWLKEL